MSADSPSPSDFEEQLEDVVHELREIRRAAERSHRDVQGLSIGLVLVLLAIIWAAAEAHDTNCYTKATLRAIASSNESPGRADCLILPWNEP